MTPEAGKLSLTGRVRGGCAVKLYGYREAIHQRTYLSMLRGVYAAGRP